MNVEKWMKFQSKELTSILKNSILYPEYPCRVSVIRNFRCKETEALFYDQPCKRFRSLERVARRKLLMLDAAAELVDLKVPPGNRLESLRSNRKGQYSIRINDQWRVCFRWEGSYVCDVEIVDYH
jgi:toxin HigB-1